MTPINGLSWTQAVAWAIVAGRIHRCKQRVYKDRFGGWTWGAA